ncbi:conserved hypothetical protein [Vibrio phage 455E52-1]|nr:conserved hypothetical protein [Vibrio phage 455E52-1]
MNKALKMRIANLTGKVTESAAVMTAITPHDAFVRFSAHIGSIEVDIHIGGYDRNKYYYTVGGFGWHTDCNINCNDTFMSNDEDFRFDDNYHDRQSIFMLEQIAERLNLMSSGNLDVSKEEIEKPINIDVDSDYS